MKKQLSQSKTFSTCMC